VAFLLKTQKNDNDIGADADADKHTPISTTSEPNDPYTQKKGRGKVVHNLAVQVHELQVEGINPLGSRMDGSSCGSKKYGLMKTTINEAVKI
jgi:hypothetical protein